MRHVVKLAFLLVLAPPVHSFASAAASTSPSLDERVAARRAVEEVLWRHRIWPADNAQPKPPLSAVLTDAEIRAKVVDDLRKSGALAEFWQRPVTDAMLAAELERMRTSSRAPDVLQEMLAAVGDDPVLAGEAIARPALVDRLIRSWYGYDDRFHGALRATAEAALARADSADELKRQAVDYREWTTVRRGTRADDATVLQLDDDEFAERRAQIARAMEHAVPGHPGTLQETLDSFYATVVLSDTGDIVTTGTAVWSKARFEDWWAERRAELDPSLDIPSAAALPLAPAAPSCADDTWTPTGGASPARRYLHAAVWTGAEMIVWGGWGDSSLVATGGRYNPATDTWLPTNVIGAPSARDGMGVIWTGSRMIVWGGHDLSGNDVNTGARYDPVFDTWTPTATAGAPTPRRPRIAVWTGSRLVIWGGELFFTPGTGGRYDPATDTWLSTTTVNGPAESGADDRFGAWTGSRVLMWPGGKLYDPVGDAWSPYSTTGQPSTGRQFFSGVWTGTEMIVWGGYLGGSAANDGGRFNPATNTWTPMTTVGAPSHRARQAAAWVGNRMVVWGGADFNGIPVGGGGRYDPASDSWTATSATGAPSARYGHTAVSAGSEVILWGGFTGFAVTSAGYRYSPASDSWVPTRADGPAPSARSGHVAVWTGSEMAVWGGLDATGGALKSGARYTPSTDAWAPMTETAAATARSGATAVWTGTRIVVWGGASAGAALGTGGRYDPASDTWSAVTNVSAPEGRSDHTAVWTGGAMIVWGGTNLFGDLDTGGRYDPNADQWLTTTIASNPGARSLHTAVWGGGFMTVWGGSAANSPIGSGGRYNPVTDSWSSVSVAGSPGARRRHAAVWTGSRMIVWGGENGGDLANGASYDTAADAWSGISSSGAPLARRSPSAVWTGAEVIVWGGASSGGHLSTGGRYRPSSDTWRATSGISSPKPRTGHTAVWIGNGMIIWGGAETGGRYGDGSRYCACTPWYADGDLDGYGAAASADQTCDGIAPAGLIGRSGDCNDANAGIHPGVFDNSCNGVDENCDGTNDENYIGGFAHCGLGVCQSTGFFECVNGSILSDCVPGPPSAPNDSACNAQDDDCDGSTDEDFVLRPDYWTATAAGPQTRTNHTSVWTGSELVVFGGDNGSGTIKVGGEAYASSTNSWRTLAAGPAKRWHHTAVWTGSRMVVWGGDDNLATLYNTGSRYDPATDTWAATTTTGAPTARGGHSAVWTGSRVVIWGGSDVASSTNTGSRYDPVGNAWSSTATSGAPTARLFHTAVWTGTEMIVWGGQAAVGGAALATGSRYNPTTNAWSAVTTTGAPTARFGHAAVWTGSEMLIWGGTDGTNFRSNGARYNPATNTWTAMSSLGAPFQRAFTSHAWTGTELIVWGGIHKTNEIPETPMPDGARYNVSTDVWTSMSPVAAPSARARASGVWTGTELIVWGGDPNGSAQSSGARYNPRTLCGNGDCQRVGSTNCASGVPGFQCTPAPPVPEICDGIDNNCNLTADEGIPLPTGHPVLFTAKLDVAGNTQFTWSPTSDTTAYDVVSGSVGLLRVSGDYTSSTGGCAVNNVGAPVLFDAQVPGTGDALWYLVRPINACSGNGSYDDVMPPQQGGRDAEINASGLACP